MKRALPLIVLLSSLAGCAPARSLPPEHLGRTIAILPPNNRTGDPLVVTGSGLIDRYVRHAETVTVLDVLVSEARFQLQEKGFVVADRQAVETALNGRLPVSLDSAAHLAAQAGLGNLVLYLEIRRWEADAPTHPAFVIVGLSGSLFDTSTGRVVWQEERRAAPVATPGEIRRESAYVSAARKVMAELLAPLRPDPPVSSKP
jgi:hypothetical protein